MTGRFPVFQGFLADPQQPGALLLCKPKPPPFVPQKLAKGRIGRVHGFLECPERPFPCDLARFEGLVGMWVADCHFMAS